MKTNPRNRPASQADVEKAYRKGQDDGVKLAMAIFLTVMLDKFDAKDKIEDIWKESNKLSEEIAEHRINLMDLANTLTEDYGIELAL